MKKKMNFSKMFLAFILAIAVVACTVATPVEAASKKEIRTCLGSYSKLKSKIGNLQLTPNRDPSGSTTTMLFMNKKGEDQGIIGRYLKSSGRITMFQNRYRKDIKCYGIYLGKKYKYVKSTMKKYHFKRTFYKKYPGSGINGKTRVCETYTYGKRSMNLWYDDGGKTVTCYSYGYAG